MTSLEKYDLKYSIHEIKTINVVHKFRLIYKQCWHIIDCICILQIFCIIQDTDLYQLYRFSNYDIDNTDYILLKETNIVFVIAIGFIVNIIKVIQ